MKVPRDPVKLPLLLLLSLSLSGPASLAQSLVNPFFEQAQIPTSVGPSGSGLLPFSELFPGWTGYLGTDVVSQAYLNELTGGTASIALIHSNVVSERVALLLSGDYTAVLEAGEYGLNSFAGATIAQTTTIPTGSLSLQFSAWGDTGALTVSFDGQGLDFSPLRAVSLGNTFYYVYGADVSSFAGQTGELSFSENPTDTYPYNIVSLDTIFFSPSPAPEPGICVLIFAGAILLALKFAASNRRDATLLFKSHASRGLK